MSDAPPKHIDKVSDEDSKKSYHVVDEDFNPIDDGPA